MRKSNALASLRREIAQLAPRPQDRQLPTMSEQAFLCQLRIETEGFRWDEERGLWRHKDADNSLFRRYALKKGKKKR